jgi:hypothetical protein
MAIHNFGVYCSSRPRKGTLEHYPVGKEVGKVTNNGEYLLEKESAS